MKRVVLAALLAFATPALSHDEVHWWSTLRTPDNATTCCDSRDCSFTEARIVGARWQALYRGAWIDVPDSAVLRVANPYGVPTLCVYGGRVLCFIQGPAT